MPSKGDPNSRFGSPGILARKAEAAVGLLLGKQETCRAQRKGTFGQPEFGAAAQQRGERFEVVAPNRQHQ
ncbi:hypothetical protein [Nocardia brasiliensis]|uniref:Uncharacterized protein n=1 Tax=Nocardia brasiliensis (strain ATCC 700358 / HUJEG-1) TaxID=1133849 RepID=K0ENT3_NOCB7|nr:hypothetical protein [Nocardia brasiliensis]AFT99086.1 hypothetical protein O3I_005620 [Nocardia brasiliensis ATCC 700358]OCF87248.1 hypothetical protein AW168_27810 [Nocardia brasiliensis]